jgi:ArsR family metal-binding transcriptional regulator
VSITAAGRPGKNDKKCGEKTCCRKALYLLCTLPTYTEEYNK